MLREQQRELEEHADIARFRRDTKNLRANEPELGSADVHWTSFGGVAGEQEPFRNAFRKYQLRIDILIERICIRFILKYILKTNITNTI